MGAAGVLGVLQIAFSLLYLSRTVHSESFPLSIIHINDFHARYEEITPSGGMCDEADTNCIGGYARVIHTVQQLLEEQKDHNPLYLNGGDSFQGTLYYNLGRWNITAEFLNYLPADAMTLGNHEFDHKIEGLVPFMENVHSPIVAANIDDTQEPSMQGLYRKSIVLERSGRRIGIIGVVLKTFDQLADTGKLKFLDESESVRNEAEKLVNDGVDIIIVISHCGYDVDQIIAKNAGAHIDIIIGSHSHTFLYTGENLPGPDTPRGDYPTEIADESTGHRVLIVQAAAYTKYVGNITLFFDDKGDVVSYEGAPIYMSADIEEDKAIADAIIPWKEMVDEIGNVFVGTLKVDLEKAPCSYEECNLGNMFTDAILHSFINISDFNGSNWSNVSMALINPGALRVSLDPGDLTYSQLVTMAPFENDVVALTLHGQDLKDTLEYAVESIDPENNVFSSQYFVQVTGMRITYNYSRPVGQRVQAIQVKCTDCDIPRFEPIDLQKEYRLVTVNFIADGGDGFKILAEKGTDRQTHIKDIDALVDYIQVMQPIITGTEGRIKIVF